MSTMLEAESKLTDRYQTTVPEIVRQTLKLGRRDKIHYVIRSDGSVEISRCAEPEEADPAIEKFLDFLERDIHDHPDRISQATDGLNECRNRIQSLVGHIGVDLNGPLSADGE